MNVLLSPITYLPMRTGVPIAIQNLARAFVKKGHQVVIVTPKLEPDHPTFESDDGIEIHRWPFVFPWRLFWERPREDLRQFCRQFPVDLRRLVRLIIKRNIEVLGVHSIGAQLPYVLVANILAGRPFVVSLHGNELFRLSASPNRVRRFLLRNALRRANHITTVSSHVAGEAARFCPEASDKIVTIPNGITVEEFCAPSPCTFGSPYLLSLARLNPLKGHDVLLLAFQEVAKREKDLHLLIAGDGSQRIRLQAIVLALGLRDRVTFLGEVGRERVKALLAGCEYLVLSSWSEGIPIAALEAMASGKAVVGTRVGGIPEVVSDFETGRLVPPGDPESLAKAMLFLLENRDQCTAMGERGRERVTLHHGFARTVDRYLDVYAAALLRAGKGEGTGEGIERVKQIGFR